MERVAYIQNNKNPIFSLDSETKEKRKNYSKYSRVNEYLRSKFKNLYNSKHERLEVMCGLKPRKDKELFGDD